MYLCMYVRMVTKAGWILKELAVFSGVIGPSHPTAAGDREVAAMPPPGGCARGGGQWAGTHGPPRSVPARRVDEDNGTQ